MARGSGRESTASALVGEMPAAVVDGAAFGGADLRALHDGSLLRLMMLPSVLEQSFRDHYRSRASHVVRRSVYGLMGLYLLVVLPIAFALDSPQLALWHRYAVYPIGAALALVWLCTRVPRMAPHVGLALRLGIFVTLTGTLYGAILLGNDPLGWVACYETAYILFVAFTLLLMPVQAVLASAVMALLTVIVGAGLAGLRIPPMPLFLSFVVPLVIGYASGCLLEYDARRDYLMGLISQKEKFRLVNDLTELVNDADDITKIFSLTLARVCAHAGWPGGRAWMVEPAMHVGAEHVEPAVTGNERRRLARFWESSLPLPWIRLAVVSGETQLHDFPAGSDRAAFMHLVFPVKLGERTLAALEFNAPPGARRDERLLGLMENICNQLARIFERKNHQHELEERALHDALTGLPNRAYLFDQLRVSFARKHRDPAFGFAVLFVDVDHFKWINDSLGHLHGDRLLVELARRLQAGIRPGDVVGRLGGDEFVIIMNGVSDRQQVTTAVTRLQQVLVDPIVMANRCIRLGSSIGAALSGDGCTEPEEILRDADIAMYHAKQQGRGTFRIFAESMREQAAGRLELVTALRQAIEDHQLVLHYQPIVSVKEGVVAGFEALARWRHPSRGLLLPEHFIPLAEETGLIVGLTDWVLAEACQQLAHWQALGHGSVHVSVNLGARYLMRPDMAQDVLAVVRAAGIAPSSLRLEITETQLAQDPGACMRNVELLRRAGIAVYIDDFGTGYSSLNQLATLQVNAIKIDRGFVQSLGKGNREAHIVKAITALSHHLGIEVIAEGVENATQLAQLRALGCNYVQGFLMSKAVMPHEAEALIGERFGDEGELPPPVQAAARQGRRS